VFVMRDKYAEFVPVRTGIAGERYFEVLGGTKVGDKVITGPFNSVRDLQDGDEVRLGETDGAKKKS
jgi:HlyD family secretion protein